ncbi:MAG: SDR family NAD(P)-dependent oxidoreductase [Promethearchaeota archaeon]
MSQQKNFMNWDNPEIALITGASSGFGATFARTLAAQGFDTILVARRKNKLDELSKKLNQEYSIQTEVLVADLANQTDIERVATRIKKLENIDVLINNAGFGTRGYFENTPLKPQINMISVHIMATVHFCRAALPIMIKRNRGVIINMSSLSSFILTPQAVMYCATKAFERIFTETLALELEGTGVKVQALCPGLTHTEFHYSETFKSFNKKASPKEWWMTTDEVVKLSLKAFQKNKVMFIPGAINQMALKIYNDPKTGKEFRQRMIKSEQISRD